MPELPEVETIKRGLEPALCHVQFEHVTVQRAGLRYPFPEDFALRLKGKTVRALTRRAKYLLVHLSCHNILIIHLGMSGRFLIEKTCPDLSLSERRHDHVVFALSNGFYVSYRDPRRFGFMDLIPEETLNDDPRFSRLGVEPLTNALTGDVLYELFRNKHMSLKAALLDQSLVAGLGNIYVCEALYRSGLHPLQEAGTLTREKMDLLVQAIKSVLNDALTAGGSTLKDYAQVDGSSGYFQHTFSVYGREGEPCQTPGCSGNIQRFVQNGRSTFFCSQCQLEQPQS